MADLIATCNLCRRADAEPAHSPCCSSSFHGKNLCCRCYCRAHFVEANPCSPADHAPTATAEGDQR